MKLPLTLPLAFATLVLTSSSQTFYEPPVAPDLDPNPSVVEYDLIAAPTTWEFLPGVQTTVWAYNGSTPGPTLYAKLGDTIRVNFTNDLPEPTTIHWHGVETPAWVDGSHISQAPIQPGETFTYEWTAINAGMHWYHPHVRTWDQVEKGLHGVIIIRDPATEHLLGFDAIPERVIVFDDVLLDASNQLVPAFSFTDALQNAVYQLNGREGNLLLVNGKQASSATMTLPNGRPVRWRVVNAANSTFARLDLRAPEVGLAQSIWQVGTDGGFTERSYKLRAITSTAPPPPTEGPDHPSQALLSQMGEGIFLMPGERMDVIFTPIGFAGQTFPVLQNDWYRGRHTASWSSTGQIVLGVDPLDGLYPTQKFMDLVVTGPNPGTGEYVPPTNLRTFPDWTTPPLGNIPYVFGHSDPNPVTGDVTFFAQAEMISGMMSPLPTAKVTSFKAHDVQVGETWQWEVTNLSHGEHPFHTHGFPFELVEYEFQDMDNPVNNFLYTPTEKRMFKDTLRVPPRLGAKGRSKSIARLRVTFDDTGRVGQVAAQGEQATFDQNGAWTSGGWLAHCHILEHSARGMLTFFELRYATDPFQLLGRFLPSTLGNASLTAQGTLQPGSNLSFHLVGAKPNTTVFLVAGNIAANRPLYGGTFVPGVTADGTTVLPKPLFAKVFSFTTGASGKGSFTTTAWEAAPSGTETYWQVAFKDPALPGKWAFSNALAFARP